MARWWLVAGLLVAGCGSGRVSADLAWTAEQEEKKRPIRETEYLTEGPTTFETDGGLSRALLGVRHDVRIAKDAQPSATCSCLAVVVATSGSDPKLAWHAMVPEIGEDALAIAVSARGVECPGGAADEAARRASISAVDREDENVFVEIEELAPGRPIALGAIVPRPGPGGALYVRPKNKNVPYARVAQGSAPCRVM